METNMNIMPEKKASQRRGAEVRNSAPGGRSDAGLGSDIGLRSSGFDSRPGATPTPNASDKAEALRFLASYDADPQWLANHREGILRQAAVAAMQKRLAGEWLAARAHRRVA